MGSVATFIRFVATFMGGVAVVSRVLVKVAALCGAFCGSVAAFCFGGLFIPLCRFSPRTGRPGGGFFGS